MKNYREGFVVEQCMGLDFFKGRKYLERRDDLDSVILDVTKKSKESNCSYLLEIFPTKDSDFDYSIFLFINKDEYLIFSLEDFSKKLNSENLYPIHLAFMDSKFDESFIDKVVRDLISNKRTITTMESCTSGMVANLITNTEGASSILKGAYVTYSNDAKVMAGVDKNLIDTFGVYSSEVAFAMANACKDSFNATIGIGVTGTTGNVDPANADSIQGEIYFRIESDLGKANCKLRIDTKNLSRKEIKETICLNIFKVLEFLEK